MTDPDVFVWHHNIVAPTRNLISLEELKRRYDRITGVIAEPNTPRAGWDEIAKPQFDGMESNAYLWDQDEKRIEGGKTLYSGGSWECAAFSDSKGLGHWHRLAFVTQHAYGYHGFFKPDFAEVLNQIPAQVFDLLKGPLYVSSTLASQDLSVVLQVKRHIGLTYVWYDPALQAEVDPRYV